jgi:catechol 2,3-dioxygenase-like lactoylglutathione lyase family enzyme
MTSEAASTPNVKQAVPFFMVTNIEASLRFYVDGLGFTLTNAWRPENAGGRADADGLNHDDRAYVRTFFRRRRAETLRSFHCAVKARHQIHSDSDHV